MQKIKIAILGTGFMGRVHTEAVRRLGNVEVAAVADVSADGAKKFSEAMGIPRHTGDWKSLVSDSEIQAVHVCTPNALHFPMSKAFLEAGKAVLCEKPLSLTAAEAKELVDLAAQKGLPNATNHNLRCYPVVQHIKQMIKSGALGEVLVVQGTYSQDWLLYDTDFNWRIEAKDNGVLRAMGDIGSHWMDQIQQVTGLKITSVCADLTTFHKTRKKPKVAIETFAGKTLTPADYDEVPIDTDDFGMVMIKLGGRAKGCFTASQVSAGNKNSFRIEVYGTRCGVQWNQEKPDELWIGHRNDPNQLIVKDPSMLMGAAKGYADLPGGHSEGYDDAHKQLFKRFYARVADPKAEIDYPTFADGLRGMQLLEAIIDSNKKRGWVDVTT